MHLPAEMQLPDGSRYDETEPDELIYYVDHTARSKVWIQEIVTNTEVRCECQASWQGVRRG
jgi:hypothetical protein